MKTEAHLYTISGSDYSEYGLDVSDADTPPLTDTASSASTSGRDDTPADFDM